MASTHTHHPAYASGSQSVEASEAKPSEYLKEAARDEGEQLKEQAQSATESLRRQGEGFFAEQKGKATGELTTLSSAIRSAADKLRGDDETGAARYAELAADKLESAANFIGKQDVGSLVREIERAARRRPELFLGGMFLVGLGISRFLKASSRSDSNFERDWRTQGSP